MSGRRSIMLYVLAFLFSSTALLPLFWMVLTSIRPAQEILIWPPSLVPRQITIEHFARLFRETRFPIYLANSLVIAISVVLVVDVAALAGGYSLSRSTLRSVKAVGVATLVGYMIAPIMIVIPFYLTMKVIGLANTRLALILAHTAFCLPFALWLMKSYIDDVPIELEKAARVDGAGRLATMLLVVLPQARAGIAAVSVFTFILSWNDYIFARILTSDDSVKTIPVGIEDIATATVVDWGLLMAAGVTVSLPVLAGFAIVHRVLIRGWGDSGLKG